MCVIFDERMRNGLRQAYLEQHLAEQVNAIVDDLMRHVPEGVDRTEVERAIARVEAVERATVVQELTAAGQGARSRGFGDRGPDPGW